MERAKEGTPKFPDRHAHEAVSKRLSTYRLVLSSRLQPEWELVKRPENIDNRARRFGSGQAGISHHARRLSKLRPAASRIESSAGPQSS